MCWWFGFPSMSRVEKVCTARRSVRPRASALVVAARGFVSICAVLAVVADVGLASVCGYAMGYGFTDAAIPSGPGLAIALAVLGGFLALLKSAVAIEIAASCLTNRAVVGAGVVWFTLLVFNWFLKSSVGAVYLTGLHVTYEVIGLSMAVLLIEVLSGYLPAFVYMTRPAQSGSASDARGAREVVSPHVPPVTDATPATVAPPTFGNFPDLFAYVREFGCIQFPGLREDPDGGLVGSQATFARIFGVARSTMNTRIWKEHGLGLIIATAGTRETKIILPNQVS